MALTVKYQKNIRGVVAVTGNTTTVYSVTISSGTIYCNNYFDLNENLLGTTNYQASGSIAPFFMPSNSYVEYAELMWTGEGGGNNNPITFITPTNSIVNLSGTLITGGYGCRIVNVTTIVRNAASGYYGCMSIPYSRLGSGWFLSVVYSNPDFPLRSCYLNTGAAAAGGTYSVTNIITPSTGPCNAAVVIAATQTDYIDKTKAYIGHTVSPTIPLGNTTPINQPWNGQPPYAPAFAFLTPNICNGNLADPNFSLLETRGTMGHANFEAYSNNMNNGYVLVPPNRLLFSLCSQNIIGYLSNNQTAVYLSTSAEASTDLIYGLMIDLNQAKMEINKTVDKDYSNKGSTVSYTLVISNTGIIAANNIVLYDTLPVGQLTFVPNSVQINYVPNSGNIETGIPLGSNFLPGDIITVTFSAILSNTLVAGDKVSNNAQIYYNYVPGVGVATVPDMALSNNATTTIISSGDLTLLKTASKSYGGLNDTITYTIGVSNFSDYNCTNIIFFDTIPTYTTFVANSLKVDGAVQGGTPDPPGFSLGVIGVGVIKTITFDVNVISIPSNNEIINNATTTFDYSDGVSTYSKSSNANEVITFINYATIISTKYVNKAYASIGDTVTYTIEFQNVGNTIADSVIFVDTMPSQFVFQSGSLTIDSIPQPTANPNPPGIIIGTLPTNKVTTISFNVTVVSVPSPNPFLNSANINYSYTFDPITPITITTESNSNLVSTTVNYVDLSGFQKYVDKNYTTINNTIGYTVVIPNKGNVILVNPILVDTVPNGTTLVPNTIKINGVVTNQNLSTGITLPDINPNEVVTVTFTVTVI